MQLGPRKARERRRAIAEVVGSTLLGSRWLARLEGISFLGTLDRHPRARDRSNRLEHSLGVAALALESGTDLGLRGSALGELVAAALVHDIGHFPLSHAAESAFASRFGANHHRMGQWIILGQGPIEHADSLAPHLTRSGLDPERVWELVEARGKLGPLFAGTINLDTLDGITRVARDFGLRGVRLPRPLFTMVEGKLAVPAAALPALDKFWRLKHRVYEEVINQPANILAEARLCAAVRTSPAWPESSSPRAWAKLDDHELALALGRSTLHTLLSSEDDKSYALRIQPGGGEALRRTRRRYYVDQKTLVAESLDALPQSRWAERWRCERETVYLVAKGRQLQLPWPGELSDLPVEGPEL